MSLACDDVAVSYRDGNVNRTVLDSVTVETTDGPVVIMGPSGSGKSTLLRVLSGAQEPDAGSVHLDGQPVQHSGVAAHDSRFAVIHQDYRLVDFLSVQENLELAVELRGLPDPAGRAGSGLQAVGLDQYPGRRVTTLSGGEQQRLAIARALITEPRVIVADEPTGALSASASRDIAQLLLDTARRAGSVLVVATHDEVVTEVLGSARYIRDGRLSQPKEFTKC